MIRGTPPPSWEETCLRLEAKLADSQKYVAELENRLRAKFNKSEEDFKHYQERIQRLVEAGDVLSRTLNMPVYHVGMVEHSREEWTKAKDGR